MIYVLDVVEKKVMDSGFIHHNLIIIHFPTHDLLPILHHDKYQTYLCLMNTTIMENIFN